MPYLITFHVIVSCLLLLVGTVTVAVHKRKKSLHSMLGNVYFWLLTLSLPIGFLLGLIEHPGTFSAFQWATPPTYVMGLIGFLAVKRKPKSVLGKPWLYWHIFGQSNSFIGVVTATIFQTIPRIMPAFYVAHILVMTIAIFALPAIIGTLLIVRTTARWIKQYPKKAAVMA